MVTLIVFGGVSLSSIHTHKKFRTRVLMRAAHTVISGQPSAVSHQRPSKGQPDSSTNFAAQEGGKTGRRFDFFKLPSFPTSREQSKPQA